MTYTNIYGDPNNPTEKEFMAAYHAAQEAEVAQYADAFPAGKPMPKAVFRELMRLVEYVNPHDEQEDFELRPDDGSNHIHHSIQRILSWMGRE